MKAKKAAARKLRPPTPPLTPEQAAAKVALANARRAWGGYDSAVETDLKRLLSCYEEQDRLIERVNRHWCAQRAEEQIIGRAEPGFAFAIAPGRRRPMVLEAQRVRPALLEHPPLAMPVLAMPQPTAEAAAAQERARQRDAANVKRWNPAVHGTIPPGTVGI